MWLAGTALFVALLLGALFRPRLGASDVVLWLPCVNEGIDVPVARDPGGAAAFLGTGRSDSAAWTVATWSSSIRDRLRDAGLRALADGTEFEESGIAVRVDGVGWAQIVATGAASREVPPDAKELTGRWEHTTGAGETRNLELRADGSAAGLAPTLRWTRWRDRLAAGFPARAGITPSTGGPDPVPPGGRDDAFDAVLAPDLRSYEGADAQGRPVRGRRVGAP
jgi:hypothetical protein